MWPYLFAVATALFVALQLAGETGGYARLRAAGKVAASSSFVACAMAAGATGSRWGLAVLSALLLSWLGDILLLSAREAAFRAGLLAFLCGHLCFVAAFLVRGCDLAVAALAALLVGFPAWRVHRWLAPHLRPAMAGPVVAYIAVICAMVSVAAGCAVETSTPLVLVAAVMFFLSDLSVARDRFVVRASVNRLWGLPLYYGAQLLFALLSGSP